MTTLRLEVAFAPKTRQERENKTGEEWGEERGRGGVAPRRHVGRRDTEEPGCRHPHGERELICEKGRRGSAGEPLRVALAD